MKRGGRKPSAVEISAAWDLIEASDPNISTEQLMQLVCDHFDNVIDHGDVASSLLPKSK